LTARDAILAELNRDFGLNGGDTMAMHRPPLLSARVVAAIGAVFWG
jgi:hypothetical protein